MGVSPAHNAIVVSLRGLLSAREATKACIAPTFHRSAGRCAFFCLCSRKGDG